MLKNSEWAALVAAIIADPLDDTVRLVAADWLEEHGEAGRAALIRMQVDRVPSRRAKWKGFRISPRRWFSPWWGGRTRYRFVNPQWQLFAWESSSGASRASLLVSRGFVTAVTLSQADWFDHCDAIRENHPVTKVALTTFPEIEFRGSDGGRTRDVCRLAGRTWRPIPHGDGEVSRTLALLHDEFPGVEFVLPPLPAG